MIKKKVCESIEMKYLMNMRQKFEQWKKYYKVTKIQYSKKRIFN